MVVQLVVICLQVIQLLGFVASTGAVSLVLWRRAREEWLKRRKERVGAVVQPAPPAHDVHVTSPLEPEEAREAVQQVPQTQQVGWRLWPCLLFANSLRRQEETGSFLKSAGTVLLVFDLLVSVIRISSIWMRFRVNVFRYRWLYRYEFLSGLAVETAYLQSLWIIYTHFRIMACLRRRDTQVTGNLFRVPCCIVLAWLSVALGPLILAEILGISHWQLRDIVSTAGALLGFVLLIYLLFAYRATLRAFQDTTNEAARRVRDVESEVGSQDAADGGVSERQGVLRRFIGACIVLVDDVMAELCPDLMDVRAEDLDLSETGRDIPTGSPQGSVGSGVGDEEQPPQTSKVEQRLRKSLRRVLKVYVATFICVMCAGIIAGIPELANTTTGKALITLCDMPYAFMGVTDAVMVGGLGNKRKFSKDAHKELQRRRRRQNGKGVVAAEQAEGR